MIGRQARRGVQHGQGLADVFDALAGDVADLQRPEGLTHLLLDATGHEGDGGGGLGDALVVGRHGRGAGQQALRHGGQ